MKAQLLGEPDGGPRLGRFLLLHQLGHGATGAVYAARDENSGAEVALKLLRAQSADAVHSFKQEFRGLTHVVHENLVQLHELFADGQEWYFTMELVRGVKFHDYARSRQGEHGELAESGEHGQSGEHGELAGRPPSDGRGRCDHDRLRGALAQLLSGVRAIHSAG
ncbi:MAG TPA: protein kinase, partial [Polyangiales bacterium]|nr:protein kinase [Polyangiales bacterium]